MQFYYSFIAVINCLKIRNGLIKQWLINAGTSLSEISFIVYFKTTAYAALPNCTNSGSNENAKDGQVHVKTRLTNKVQFQASTGYNRNLFVLGF